MKKIITSTIFILFTSLLFAQKAADSLPAYKRLPAIPPFVITVVNDSTIFAKENLQKKKQTLIIMFSPDCGHCEHATQEIITKYEAFKKVQIVMASNAPYETIKKFYDKYKLANYLSIKVGMDKNYFLGSFYSINSYPTIFLYNKKGKFKATFTSSNTIDEVIAAL